MTFSIKPTQSLRKKAFFSSLIPDKYEYSEKDENFYLSLSIVESDDNKKEIENVMEDIRKIYKKAKEHINNNENVIKLNTKTFEDWRSKEHNNNNLETEFKWPFWFTKKTIILFFSTVIIIFILSFCVRVFYIYYNDCRNNEDNSDFIYIREETVPFDYEIYLDKPSNRRDVEFFQRVWPVRLASMLSRKEFVIQKYEDLTPRELIVDYRETFDMNDYTINKRDVGVIGFDMEGGEKEYKKQFGKYCRKVLRNINRIHKRVNGSCLSMDDNMREDAKIWFDNKFVYFLGI